MRLTLRTLLAYRDNVLSPADREDLHRRIQSSQFGGNLLRGIGEVTQRSPVGAPPVLGKGLGADANSIAEYLDDALPHSQVPELERICLDSAVQLAELADCHSLLSSAVQTKVSVSADLRRMALGLGDSTQRDAIAAELDARKQSRRRGKLTTTSGSTERDSQVATAAAPDGQARPDLPVHVEAPMLASGGESIRPQGLNLETNVLTHEVPEYLIGTASGQWKFPLAIGGLLALLIVLVWQALGPLENVMELFAKVPAKVESSQTAVLPVDLDTIDEAEQVPPGIAAPKAGEAIPTDVVDDIVADDIVADDAAPPGASPSSERAAELDAQLDVESESAAPPGIALNENETPPKPAVAAPPASSTPATNSSDQIESSQVAPPGLATPTAADVAAELKAFSNQDAPHDAADSKAPSDSYAVWLPSDDAAAQAVILWRDGDTWRRVESATPLPVGSHWVIPPATRTSIDLPGGVHWIACGPSKLELATVVGIEPSTTNPAEPVANEQAAVSHASSPHIGIATQLCRALVRGSPDGRDLRLSTPVGDFQIQWLDPNSLVSIEVGYRPVAAGSVLDRQATKPVLIIVAADERVTVTKLSKGGASHQLGVGDGLACVGESKPITFRLQNIPNWYRSSTDRPIDNLAASDLHRFAQSKDANETDEAAGILAPLVELSQSRRPETAALAVQTALLCGDWKPLAAGFLDDARMRSHWMPTIHLARQVLAANPTAESELRGAFNATYGDEGSELVDLLCGLPAGQVDPAALAPIVQRLESPQLAFRVLALYQLETLTGKSLGVQPAAVSRTAVQQWRRELATNRDLILPIGDPIWERIPR